jgi:protein MON2
MLLKSLSDKHLFPLTLRATRVVFLLLKQFLRELETESEVFLTLLTKIICGEIDGNEAPRPHWMRVLAMEITRGYVVWTASVQPCLNCLSLHRLCSDADLVREIWDRFDAKKNGSHVFSSLITALKRLATEKPALLGVESQMFGLGIPSQSSLDLSATGYGLDVGMVAGMVASAASMVASIGSETGLSVPGSSMKLQW